jgi:hypothetical protein
MTLLLFSLSLRHRHRDDSLVTGGRSGAKGPMSELTTNE